MCPIVVLDVLKGPPSVYGFVSIYQDILPLTAGKSTEGSPLMLIHFPCVCVLMCHQLWRTDIRLISFIELKQSEPVIKSIHNYMIFLVWQY